MPALLEAEHVDVETQRAVHVGNEENRARVPPVNNLATYGLLRHLATSLFQPQHFAGRQKANRLLQAPGFRLVVLGGLNPAEIPSTV